MATSQVSEVIQYLRRTVLLPGGAAMTDGQLLSRFVEGRDEDAFAALVKRHGPMVWGVCRRLLANDQDAEDAFQATFLVLVRKAATVQPREMVANWLYGVAYMTAHRGRVAAAKARRRERQVAEMPEPAVAEPDLWEDLRAVLDQELTRLPDQYRVVVVLCDLEGKTRKEAVRQLGLPEGTVASRLARARAMLAKRLTQRGVTLSGGALAALLSQKVASAGVPASVVSSTIKAVTLVTAGQAVVGLISVKVAALTEGVVKAMLVTKIKSVLALVLVIAALAGAAGLIYQTQATEKAKDSNEVVQAPKPAEKEAMGRPIRSLKGHQDRVNSVAFSPDGRWIGTAASDGTARLWDAKTGEEVRRLLDVTGAWSRRILFSPDNKFIVTTVISPDEKGGNNDVRTVIVWSRRTGEKVRQFPGFSFAFSPDGRLIACGGWDRDEGGWIRGIIRLYDFATGKLLRELSGHLTEVVSLAFSSDGKSLVSVGLTLQGLSTGEPGEGETKFTRVWDVATGKEKRTVQQARESVIRTFSPDGRTLGSTGGSSGDEITLWEAATGGRRAELTGHTGGVWEIAFSPDSRTLASAGGDGTVRLWDLPSGKEVGRLEGHKGVVFAVAFSPDGRTLVSGGLDKTTHLWDVSRITGRRRETAEHLPVDFETDWKELAQDAAAGYAALARLVSSSDRAVAFLGKQLQSTKPPDAKRIEQLIAGLDAEQFKVREKASKKLETLAEFAEPALRKALAGEPSAEARRRLEALLARLDGAQPSTEMVRQIRAVEALESIGNVEARRLLDKLAGGPTETRLTQEAKAAAGRLARRTEVAP
jgi:RNA polymerase sigma factor (sigma-70 family)